MNRFTLIGALVALVLGGVSGYWLAPDPMVGQETDALDGEAGTAAREVLFYRNPMNPAITSPVPAEDEMGMAYLPVYADTLGGGDAPAGTVKIDPVTAHNIGVRTARAQRQSLSREIRSVGRVDFDEERLSRLHPKTEGWIEELYIDKTGEPIDRDTILLNIYSPQLVSSQQEYLLALNNLDVLRDSPYAEIRDGARSPLARANGWRCWTCPNIRFVSWNIRGR